MKNNHGFSIINILIVVLFSAGIGYGVFYYFSQNSTKKELTAIKSTAKSECAKPEEFSTSMPKKLPPLTSEELKKYENISELNAFNAYDILLFNENPGDKLLQLSFKPEEITFINTDLGYVQAYTIGITECIDKLQPHIFENGGRIESLDVNGLKFYYIDGWGHSSNPEIPADYRENPNEKYIVITRWGYVNDNNFENVLRTIKFKPKLMDQ